MKTFMLPGGMVVSVDDLRDILEHADTRTQLLQRVVAAPMDCELLLEIIKELECKPGYDPDNS